MLPACDEQLHTCNQETMHAEAASVHVVLFSSSSVCVSQSVNYKFPFTLTLLLRRSAHPSSLPHLLCIAVLADNCSGPWPSRPRLIVQPRTARIQSLSFQLSSMSHIESHHDQWMSADAYGECHTYTHAHLMDCFLRRNVMIILICVVGICDSALLPHP